jgi:hypothetical protein
MRTLKIIAPYTRECRSAAKMIPIAHCTTNAATKKTTVCRRLAQNNGLWKALTYESNPSIVAGRPGLQFHRSNEMYPEYPMQK